MSDKSIDGNSRFRILATFQVYRLCSRPKLLHSLQDPVDVDQTKTLVVVVLLLFKDLK